MAKDNILARAEAQKAIELAPVQAQITLAKELTKLIHGEAALLQAEAATQELFGTEIKNLDLATLEDVFSGAPTTQKQKSELVAGIAILDLLIETGLFQSKGAARKEIPAGGVYLNNERITDPTLVIKSDLLIANHALVLRKGKKNYHLVKFN